MTVTSEGRQVWTCPGEQPEELQEESENSA